MSYAKHLHVDRAMEKFNFPLGKEYKEVSKIAELIIPFAAYVARKNEIGLSRKLIGLKTNKFFCIECLAEYLEVTVDELIAKIEEFKDEGCTLFD